MNIVKHPEWSKEYPAIDGIERDPSYPTDHPMAPQDLETVADLRLPIRSDVARILELDDESFHLWYTKARDSATSLLTQFEHVAKIPDLRYSRESQQHHLDSHVHLQGVVDGLRLGLDYLDKIKQVRDEMNAD